MPGGVKNRTPYFICSVFFLILFCDAAVAQSGAVLSSYAGVGSAPRVNSIGSDISISAVSVLLPQDPSVAYRLDVFNGCFKWSVMNPDVVDLEIPSENSDCARTVYVRPSSRYASGRVNRVLERERTWITAEDKQTQRVIRAEIFVDQIHRIDVMTVNRNMRKDDIEVIGIQAFDAEGNVFSTIEGLVFDWTVQLEPNTGRDGSSLLQILPFKDHHIEATDKVLSMEQEGKLGGAILVQAKNTGKVSVTARLFGSNTLIDRVIISILEPLNLVPSTMIYLPPKTTIQYILQTFERESFRNISMPNKEYTWRVSNDEIASVDELGIVTTKDKFGTTTVEAQFITVDDNSAYGQLSVVEPYSLDILLVSDTMEHMNQQNVRQTSTYIIEDLIYTIVVQVYDIEGHRLYNIDKLNFNIHLDTDFFERIDSPSMSSNNQARIQVRPRQSGISHISVRLEDSSSFVVQREIKHTESVTIVPPLKLVPAISSLSFPYVNTITHSIQFEVSGGSGSYVCTSTNRQVIAITSTGFATSGELGQGLVRCVDTNLVHNKIELPTLVSWPERASFSAGIREAETGQPLILGLTISPETQSSLSHIVSFTNCSSLNFHWNLTNADIFSFPTPVLCPKEDPLFRTSCACFSLSAIREGTTLIKVSFDNVKIKDTTQQQSTTHGQKPTSQQEMSTVRVVAETTINSFAAVQVQPSTLLVSFGSESELVVIGGPQAWSSNAPVIPKIEPQQPSAVRVEPITSQSSSSLWKYKLTCTGLSEQLIHITVGTPPTLANPDPVSFKKSIYFACKVPQAILLHPSLTNASDVAAPYSGDPVSLNVGSPSTCQLDETGLKLLLSKAGKKSLSPTHYTLGDSEQEGNSLFNSFPSTYLLRTNYLANLEVSLFDEFGNSFDTFTSLELKWDFSGAIESKKQDSSNNKQIDFQSSVLMHSTHAFLTSEKNGKASIEVSITGYKDEILKTYGHSSYLSSSNLPSLPLDKLQKSFNFEIVSNALILPKHKSLFNSVHNRALIHVEGGSGLLTIKANTSSSLALVANPGSASVYVSPIRVGITRLSVIDSCVFGNIPTTSIIRVSDVHGIRLRYSSIIQLDSTSTVEIEVLNSIGQPFDADQLKLLELRLHLEGDSIQVVQSGSGISPVPGRVSSSIHGGPSSSASTFALNGRSSIQITGASVGVTTISIAMVKAAGQQVILSSTPVQISVFAPLSVYPPVLELLPRGTFQLEINGGPPSRSRLHFRCENQTIASVSADGVVSAKNLLGETSITIQLFVLVNQDTAALLQSDTSRLVSHQLNSDGSSVDEIVFEQTIQLQVSHLNGILIHASTTRLIVGQELVVHVVGQDQETPFVWSGIDLAFQWEAINPSILKVHSLFAKANVTTDEETGISVVVKALAPGTTRLSCRIVAGPAYLGAKSASLSFEVVPALTLVDTSHVLFPNTLLLAPHTSHHLRTTVPSISSIIHLGSNYNAPSTSQEDLSTSVGGHLEDSIIRLDSKSEYLVSTGVAGSSLIQIRDRRDQQVLHLQVLVKPIHHIELRARPGTSWDIGVGSVADFDVVVRDNLGREFDSYDRTKFVWNYNKHDILHLELLRSQESEGRFILRIKGLRPGKTMIRFSVDLNNSKRSPGFTQTSTTGSSPNFEHFMMLRVSNAILPVAPVVHLGSNIHFKTSFGTGSVGGPLPSPTSPVWSSSSDRVVKIDGFTGIAFAQGFGKASIVHNSSVYSMTYVRVVPVASVIMDTRQCTSMTNLPNLPGSHHSCFVPLTFLDSDGREFVDTELIQHNIHASCYSDYPNTVVGVFTASTKVQNPSPQQSHSLPSTTSALLASATKSTSEDISNNGIVPTFGCRYVVQEQSGESLERISLKVNVTDEASSYVLTEETFVPFISSFVLDIRTLHFSPSEPVGYIKIHSPEKLLVTSRDTKLVNIELYDHDFASNTFTYRVTVSDGAYPFQGVPIDFINPNTRQADLATVSYGPSNQEAGLTRFTENQDDGHPLWTAILMAFLTFCVAYVASKCFEAMSR